VTRYLRLAALSFKLSLATGAQYRWNFVIDGLVAILWTALGVVPLLVAFRTGPGLEGWSFGGAMLVIAWFTLLKGLLDGAVSPSLLSVVQHIREGTLDFVLLKPADAQFLVSTARFEPFHGLDVFAAVGLFIYAFVTLGAPPPLWGVALALVLAVCATLVLYSIWILVVSAAFFVVRLDNLAYLFSSIFDFARWPVTVFRGAMRLFFTVVIPLALLTTFPAQALLGTITPLAAVGSILGSIAFATAARMVWRRAISRYTSASS
jgi:ABC-2 type transport system permease protein